MCSNNPPSFLLSPHAPLAPPHSSALENLSHRSSSPSPHSQQQQQQQPSATATSTLMLLDVTTIQGLLLYTLYLLHRIGFFRWRRDTQRISLLCQQLSFWLKPMDKSSTLSTTTVQTGSGGNNDVAERNDEKEAGTEVDGQEEQAYAAESEKDRKADTAISSSIATTRSINDTLPLEILVQIFDQLSVPSYSSSLCSSSWSPSLQQHCHSHYPSQRQGQTLHRCMLVCRTWYELIGPRVWKYPRVLWSRHWSRFYPISLSTSQFHQQHFNQRQYQDRSVQELDNHENGTPLLFPRLKDPIELLAGNELHELDRQELEDWVMWKKEEKHLRAKDHRLRKFFWRKQSSQQTGARNRVPVEQDSWPRSSDITVDVPDTQVMETGAGHGAYFCYSDDGQESDSTSEGDSSEDEGSLIKLVSGIDRLQSLIRTHLSSTEEPTTTPTTELPNSLYLPLSTDISSATSSLNLPFSKAIRRLRRREALRDMRRRMCEMRDKDGLPASLPLQMCGPWIQVINLQQETTIPQRLGSQVWGQQSSYPMTPRDNPTRRRRRSRGSLTMPQETMGQIQRDQENRQDDQWLSRLFSLMFTGSTGPRPTTLTTAATISEPKEPSRLRSRRDLVTDRTLQTILESCPGLCRLNLSECHGITDQGMMLIRDSSCVARQTLVSLHFAGCFQLTDQGISNLLVPDAINAANNNNNNNNNNSNVRPVRLESLDLAGCFQISDQGLIPFLKQCGTRLIQLRVSDCEEISSRSVMALAEHCSQIQWLDMARSGVLTEESLISLANRCQDLEWLNMARCHPSDLESAGPVSSVSTENEHAEDEEGEREEVKKGDGDKDDQEVKERAETEEDGQDSISDGCIAQICESCPKLQLLDLSYIGTLTNTAIESLADYAKNLICLTIIGCPGITSVSLAYLARLRNTSGKLGCITMGDAQGISERDIEQIMQGTLSGWQKSLVDETNLGEILGRSWDE